MDDAIEQAARRLGMWATMPPASDDCWRIEPRVGRTGPWQVWRRVESLPTTVNNTRLDSPTAALFLLLLGLPEVAVTCPACAARGRRWDSETIGCAGVQKAWRYAESKRATGWHVIEGEDHDGRTRLVCSRPCPTCTVDGQPRGKVEREPARLLLDATPTPCPRRDCRGGKRPSPTGSGELADCSWCMGSCSVDLFPGDETFRRRLEVLADDLNQRGDPRGEWLALWARGEFETEDGPVRPIDRALQAIEAELMRIPLRLALDLVRELRGNPGIVCRRRVEDGTWLIGAPDEPDWTFFVDGGSTELEALDIAAQFEQRDPASRDYPPDMLIVS